MTDQPEPLKQGDEVFIKSLGVSGKVLCVRPGDIGEPEQARNYEVQITRYFRRTDLEPEPDSRSAERKRELDIQEKTERFAGARSKLEETIATGGAEERKLTEEFLHAFNDLWQASGHEPFLVPIKPSNEQ